MSWQQIVIIVLNAMDLGMAAIKHGERREGKYSFWSTLIVNGFIVWVLYSAGFFN